MYIKKLKNFIEIRGYEKTPYENGIFKLDINIPDR